MERNPLWFFGDNITDRMKRKNANKLIVWVSFSVTTLFLTASIVAVLVHARGVVGNLLRWSVVLYPGLLLPTIWVQCEKFRKARKKTFLFLSLGVSLFTAFNALVIILSKQDTMGSFLFVVWIFFLPLILIWGKQPV